MDSLPPPPLRLLPAGTTSCRVGIAPTENPNLAQRTPWKGDRRPVASMISVAPPGPDLDYFTVPTGRRVLRQPLWPARAGRSPAPLTFLLDQGSGETTSQVGARPAQWGATSPYVGPC